MQPYSIGMRRVLSDSKDLRKFVAKTLYKRELVAIYKEQRNEDRE